MSRQFIVGLALLILLIVLDNIYLPFSCGDENGVIENVQVVILISATFICFFKTRSAEGRTRSLWIAGTLLCLLLAGRELSWGRVFFPPMASGNFPPVKALPYGPLVYPLIGVTMLSIIALIIRGKAIAYLHTHSLPHALLLLLVITAFIAADAEKFHLIPHTNGTVIEELAETYTYAIFAYMLSKMKAS